MVTESEIRARLDQLRAERTAQLEAEFKRGAAESEQLEKQGQESLKQLMALLKEQKLPVEEIHAIGVSTEWARKERAKALP